MMAVSENTQFTCPRCGEKWNLLSDPTAKTDICPECGITVKSDSLRSTGGQPCDDSAIGRKSMSNGMGNPGTLSGVASCSFDADEEQGISIKKHKEADIMVIQFDLLIMRGWLDPSDDDYSLYEETLTEKLQALDDTWLVRDALINERLIKSMRTALENEIKYCQFHKEYHNRIANEPHFNEWVFTENVESGYWEKIIGNEWTRTNGRIKAIIRIMPPETEGKMTRIELKYENDSSVLTFIDRYIKDNKPHNLKNPESIKQRIKELKEKANEYFISHLYPQWNVEKRNLNGLNKILSIFPSSIRETRKRTLSSKQTITGEKDG